MIRQRKERWCAFHAGKRDRLVLIQRDYGVRPLPNPENKEGRIAYALSMYRTQLAATERYDDDRVPYLSPYTGTEIFARAFGSAVHRPAGDMPFALPVIHSAKEAAKLKPSSIFHESLQEVFEIADALRKEEPEGVMALPDIQSALDVTALLWEKSDFFAAMIEEPEAVMTVTAMVQQLLVDFLDEWFRRYGKELVAHYPDYYLPQGITLSEDEVGTISPALFRKFSLDNINALSSRYGGLGVHCCANSKHQWAAFQEMKGLCMLNLVQPPELLEEAYHIFRDICGQMHGMLHIKVTNGQWTTEKTGLSSGGRLILQGMAQNDEEAAEMTRRLRELAEVSR